MQRLPWEMWLARDRKTLWTFLRLKEGAQLGNTQGFAHGGLLAALFDGQLGSLFTMCGVSGFTANLSVDYRRPVPIPSDVLMVARLDGREGRKLWISGQLTALETEPNDGDPVVCAEARGLFLGTNTPDAAAASVS